MTHDKMYVLILLLSVLSPCFISNDGYAQKIDNLASYRAMDRETYFRFSYDNDFFTARDQNYTQGYSFEVAHPTLKKNPLNYLLFKNESSQRLYGLSLEHIGFTPGNIASSEIQQGDRPFASAIMLKSFLVNTNINNKSRLSSSLSLGVIGPIAFGEWMQQSIHKATGNIIPEGWPNQIQNDVVINYEVAHEKQLYRYKNIFALRSNALARLGTLHTGAQFGVNMSVGIINNPFKIEGNRGLQLYLYAQPLVHLVGYDATLQGGLFNNTSNYTIENKDVNRVVGQGNYGIVLKTKSIYMEYCQSIQTKEHKSGTFYRWGGVKFGFVF